MHIAETEEERTLLEDHRGPFVEFLKDVGAWDPSGLAPSLKSILERLQRAKSPLLVHCNYLESDTPLPENASVVYCPRTHAAFRHPEHPFRAFMARGIRVALGTDSLASNPDLSVLEETRFVQRQHPDVSGTVLLRMATLSGAEALGFGAETGSLEPGKAADLVILPVPTCSAADPHWYIFGTNLPVQRVMARGQWVVGNP